LDQHSIRAVEDYLHMGLPGDAGALLLIEVDGETDEIDRKIHRVREVCEGNGAREVRVATDKAEQAELWKARRSVTASLMKIRPKKLNEDIAVPRARIPDILSRLDETARKHDVLIVNFGHAGDGNVHVNVLFDSDPASEKRAHAAVDDVFRATVELGGRISGEHGIGLTKRKYISWCLDANVIAVMRRMKTLFDPHGILNPGKMFPATETNP
jgi:glycolate oxidase